jgi:hypothetical protein
MSLIDQIIGVESGGNANAKNPRSSATGAGQFISATWIDMLSRHRPDLVQGKSQEEILALRNDPQLSREMTAAYAADNGEILAKAGLPVTNTTQYLAHFAGPQGAVKVLGADPDASVESILGAGAVKANPFLQGMTVADLQAWAGRKMGQPAPSAAPSVAPPVQTAALQPAQKPAPAAPQIPANAAPATGGMGPLSFAPQQAWGGALLDQAPMQQAMAGGLLAPPQRPKVDLSKLRATFQPQVFSGVRYS